MKQKQLLLRCRTLYTAFFRISAVTVGGGLTMLPLMSREFVEKHRLITEEDMVDTVAVVQSMPGIIAVNMAILVGFKVAGLAGAVVAAFSVVTPPFLTISVIAMCVRHLTGSETMNHIFLGVRAAVCALILLSVIKMAKNILKNSFAVILSVIGFISLVFFNMNVVYLILGSAVAGVVYCVIRHRLHPPENMPSAGENGGKHS